MVSSILPKHEHKHIDLRYHSTVGSIFSFVFWKNSAKLLVKKTLYKCVCKLPTYLFTQFDQRHFEVESKFWFYRMCFILLRSFRQSCKNFRMDSRSYKWILCTLDTKNNNIICLRRHQIPYETLELLSARVIITSVIIFITPLWLNLILE